MTASKVAIIFLLFLECLYESAQAQVVIRGKVSDVKGNGIPDVSVWAAKSDTLYALQTSSDQYGTFRLPLSKRIKAPVYFRFTCTGYETKVIQFQFLPIKDTLISVKLNAVSISLKGININSHGKKMDTTAFSADSVKRLYHRNIEQLLLEIPGLSVGRNGLEYKGKAITKVLFEGDNLGSGDYQHLLKSLSPHSLDSIQVIENYIDKTELGNAYKKYGDEIVLNFKFKGKKKIRNYGRFGAGAGLPGPVYEAALDNLAIIKSLKMVNLANYNTKGAVTSYLFEKSDQYLNANRLSNMLEPQLISDRPLKVMLEPPAVAPEQIGVERLYANNSAFFTTDFFDRINRKVFVNGNVKGLYDRIPEYLTVTEVFSDKSYIDTYRSSNILRRKLAANADANLNWLLNTHLQYTAGIKLSDAPIRSNANTFLNGIPDIESYKGKSRVTSFINQMTWLMPHNRNLKAEAYVTEENTNEYTDRESIVYNRLFNSNNVLSVNQQFIHNSQRAGASARFEVPLPKRTNLILNNGLNIKRSSLGSSLSALDTSLQQIPVNTLFFNNVLENRQVIYSQLELNRSGRIGANAFSAHFTSMLRYVNLKVNDFINHNEKHLSKHFLFDPRISLEYTLQERFVINADLFHANRLPDPAILYNGLILYDQNQLRSGFDTLKVIPNDGFSLQIRKTASKMFFSVRYTYANSPITEGYAFASQGIFNFIKGAYIANHFKSNAWHVSLFLNLSKTNISLNSYLNLSKNSFILNGSKLNTDQFYSTHNLSIRHSFSNNVNNQVTLNLNTFSNSQTEETGLSQSNHVYNGLLTDEFNVVFLKAWSVSINNKAIILGGNGLNREHYYFLDFKITRNAASDRFTTYLEARNVLNKKVYSVTSQNLFIQSQHYAEILPGMFILGLEIKL